MQPGADDSELINHFSVFIYPFLHGLTRGQRTARLDALAARWEPWWWRLGDAAAAEVLDGSTFFLPYVQDLLFPEVACLRGEAAGPHCADWVGRVRQWTGEGLGPFGARLPAGAVLRLTARPPLRPALAEFTVVHRRPRPARHGEPAELRGRLDWLDAVLFPSGVGFLLLAVRLADDRPHLSRLIELNAALRLVHPPSLTWELPTLHFARGAGDLQVRDLINVLTRGLVEPAGVPAEDLLFPLADGVPASGYADSEPGRAYGERCHLFSYACVHLPEADQAALPAGPFASGVDRLLYEYATSIRLGDAARNPVWVPSPEQAERVRRDNRLSVWRCWRGMALKESCVFLGTEDLGFNRKALPHAAEHDYLPLYLYTLYQKYRLLTFADGLMREVAQAEGHLRGARALLRRFVAFRNRFWFSEVTRRPQGGDLYRLLQQALEVPQLYDMVTASVKEAKEYYEERWDRQVRTLTTTAGAVGGPLAAVWGVARLLLAHPRPVWVMVLVLGVIAAVAVGILLGLWRRSRRRAAARRGAFGRRGSCQGTTAPPDGEEPPASVPFRRAA
jgi:hypothetical protein